ncbi:putative retrotransposon gag domain-containing protein [Helianthus annuus]|nr:putative retrotransposon gag domain-containing protein [Helianthus annuus]
MSESGSSGEVNQVPNTSTPGTSQVHVAIPTSFSTLGSTPEFLTFSTPTPSRSGVPSPNIGVSSTPSHVELTPELVANNFLELRPLLNQYVSRERDKGVRIRLDYDEPEPTLSPGPPIPPFANSQSLVSRDEAGPSNPTPNPNPYLSARPNPTAYPLFSSQPATNGAPLGHELTLDQLLQSPVTSLPPSTTTSWEQGLCVLPLARSAVMSTPLGVSCPDAPESLQGFNLMPQMMASFPWQHFINQVLATQGNNSNNNNAGVRAEEDLAKLYKPSNLSCFSQQIADYDFQTKIKMAPHIKTYDGTEDPEDHLQIFTGAARIEKWSNAECCLMFMQTLVGSARIWFNDLPARSVRSFDDLSKGFLANFSQQRRYVKNATVIFQIKQRDDESLREFIERYKKEGLTYVGADEKMRVAGFMKAITSKYLTRDFNKSLPKTLEEALERAEAHIRGEEAVDIKEQRKRGSSWRGHSPARKRGNFNSYDRRQKGSEQRRSEGRNPSSREKGISFTPLNKTPQEILATEEVKQNFRPPRPLPKSRKNENSTQYCEFHE